jgi:polysaccharide pyruvyl transferase WcaK-like protein
VRFSRLIGEIAHIGYVLRVLTKIDVLLISGGGQLDDFFGGAWQHPYTLFKWVVLSKLARTKVIFLSVGVGNISTDLSKGLLRAALGLADYRSYRDEGSREMVRATLGAHLDAPVVPDMAFAFPVCTAHLGASQPSGRLVVAVGPMPFCHPDLWPIRNRLAYESYLEALSLFCDRLLRRGVTLRMFPGQTRNDPPVIDDLIRRLRKLSNNASEVLIDVPPVRSVNELLSCIAEADIVLASRFHGALLALLLRRPVLALSYERKVNQLMKDLNLEEYCVDIEQANVDSLSDVFARLQANSDSIARDLETAVRLQTEAVHAQFDFLVTELLPYAGR